MKQRTSDSVIYLAPLRHFLSCCHINPTPLVKLVGEKRPGPGMILNSVGDIISEDNLQSAEGEGLRGSEFESAEVRAPEMQPVCVSTRPVIRVKILSM